MNTSIFSLKNLFIFLIAVGVVFTIYTYKAYSPAEEEKLGNDLPQAFMWKYEKSESLNLDGQPKTVIFLEATYASAKVDRKQIDTVDGSCNEYDKRDANVYPRSQVIICYYAGLGQYYQVIEEDGKYLVQKKGFEEGVPNVTPTPQEFKTILQF